jgi:predicted site-specific integrase-resolvase
MIILSPVILALSHEAELVQDVLALVTSFSGRLHRMRRRKNKIVVDEISNQINPNY